MLLLDLKSFNFFLIANLQAAYHKQLCLICKPIKQYFSHNPMHASVGYIKQSMLQSWSIFSFMTLILSELTTSQHMLISGHRWPVLQSCGIHLSEALLGLCTAALEATTGFTVVSLSRGVGRGRPLFLRLKTDVLLCKVGPWVFVVD